MSYCSGVFLLLVFRNAKIPPYLSFLISKGLPSASMNFPGVHVSKAFHTSNFRISSFVLSVFHFATLSTSGA
jgi:hypothetical protein